MADELQPTQETRSPYYYVDAEGYLVSTLFLTPEERAARTDLVDEKPTKVRPVGVSGGVLISLDKAKELKWNEMKLARDTTVYSPFVWDGSTFDADPTSQQRIAGAVQLATLDQDFTVDWTLANNTVRTLTAANMIAVGVALGQAVNAAYEKGRLLRNTINAATTVDAVMAITW